MLLLKLLRFLLGYVCFRAKDGFPERFINLCRLKGIVLWNLNSKESVISACVACKDYRKIRSAARKSGMKVRIYRKIGLPFLLDRYSHRVGVAVGAVFCVAVICVLSTRLWSINVTGNVNVTSERIIGVFEELGVRRGIGTNEIDIKALEIEAMKRLPEISWLNINFDGSVALIEVRETEADPQDNGGDVPSDIVAARDGQIVILRPFNGTQEQKIGNSVLKGDLLISGIEENKDLTVSFCRAKGYVVARTCRKVSAVQGEKLKILNPVLQKETFIIHFLTFSFPLGKPLKNAYRERSELCINGVVLPVGITRCVQNDYKEAENEFDEKQRELLGKADFFEKCVSDFRYLEVENAEIKTDSSAQGFEISGEFKCLENIGKEIPMEIEEAAPRT